MVHLWGAGPLPANEGMSAIATSPALGLVMCFGMLQTRWPVRLIYGAGKAGAGAVSVWQCCMPPHYL